MNMSTFLAITIMCLLGYIGFMFVGESMNPMKRSQVSALRRRHTHGLMVGAMIALASLAAFFVPGSVLDKLKVALPVAAVLLAVYLTYTLIKNLLRRKREASSYNSTSHQASKQDDNNKSETTQPAMAVAATTAAVGGAMAFGKTETAESAKDETNDVNVANTASTSETEAEHPLDQMKLSLDTNQQSTKNDLVDQAHTAHPLEGGSPELADALRATQTVNPGKPDAANSHQFSASQSVDHDEIVVDDLFEPSVLAVDSDNEDKGATAEASAEQTLDTTDLTLGEAGANGLDIDTSDTVDMNDVYTAPIEETFIHEEFEAVDEPEETENTLKQEAYSETDALDSFAPAEPYVPVTGAQEYDQLTNAVEYVSAEAEHIEGAVGKINELHQQEQYFRTELNGARLALEKAREAELEARTHEVKIGKRQLQEEKSRRLGLENNLEERRQALYEAENRVRELEEELFERRRVFHDQMESLTKTKAMARNAALLARKAAVAQQSARTEALKERAARERLEVSAKRAVDIARNAISKLAEEERKNRSHGLH